jgi:hypothetical protein
MLDAAAARAWCTELSRSLRIEAIRRGQRPYLDRYFVAGWNPYDRQRHGALFLHHFRASDEPDRVHSHPWAWALSLILSGGYTEERCDPTGQRTVHTYRPGDVNVLVPTDRHRVELLESDCWTLFLTGDYQQPWTFFPHCR